MNDVNSATPCPGSPVIHRQAAQIFRKVWEICPAAIVVTDPSGCIEYVNPAFEKLNGYSADEVVGKNPRILNARMQGPEVYEQLWKTISSGGTWTGRMQNRRKDGSLYWESSIISPLCDKEGKILHYVAVKENVTPEVESGEDALNARRETDLLAEQSGTVYWKLNAQGLCTEVSRSCLKVWGYRPEEIVGHPFYELHPEPIREESKLKGAEIFERKEAFANFLHQLTTRDGRLIWVMTNGVPIVDEVGCFLGFSGTDTDVTEQIEAKRTIAESEQRFRNMADTAPVLLWMSGTDALCDYFNQPWLDFTGRSLDQELGRGWTEGVHPDDLQRCMDIYLVSFEARHPFRMEYRLRHADGEYRWLLDNGTPRFSPGGAFLGFIGSCVDITERKNAEGALAIESLRNRALLQAASDGIHVVDEQGNLVEVSEEFCRMLGYTREEVLRLKIANWDAQWSEVELAAKLKVLISEHSGSPVAFETRHRRKDGTFLDVEINGVSVSLDGKRYLATIQVV